MVLNVIKLLYLAAFVQVITTVERGVAVIEQLREQDSVFNITFVLSKTTDPVRAYSSFTLQDHLSVSWQIHDLPLKMGSESCSKLELGGCFECTPSTNDLCNDCNNNYNPKRPICINGNELKIEGTDLHNCVRIHGKYGLVGRSVVVRVRNNQREHVYCSNIYEYNVNDDGDLKKPPFISSIAWFNTPLTGFVAFRKESQAKSYIIVNLTRTVDNNLRGDENLKWEIRTDISDRKYLWNPREIDTTDSTYNNKCDPTSDSGHQSCAVGDLGKKHGRLRLKNDLSINLKMYVDQNLDSVTLVKKYIVILNTTKQLNGTTSDQIVAYSKIDDLQPISTSPWFFDGSVLFMVQRDDWSPIEHRYEPSNLNTAGKWVVTVYQVPPIQIFGGDQWNCDEITSQGWSASQLLPSFETSRKGGHLNQTYTLYGRNSMMYHGVSVSSTSSTSSKCATITYKQDKERIAYSVLAATSVDRVVDQRVMVVFIEHTVVRQTTIMLATLCSSNQFFLQLTDSPVCDELTNPYNPFGVCPAYCPLAQSVGTSCERKCPPFNSRNNSREPKYADCCTMCVYNSSYLCPIGDLRNRLDVFRKANRRTYMNRETVFSVKNDVNLPLKEMVNKYVGLYIDGVLHHHVLTQCGVVEELTDTVVRIDSIKGGVVTLNQTAPWQPITAEWDGIDLVSLTFWEEPDFTPSVCSGNDVERKELYRDDDFGFTPDGIQVQKRKTLKKTDKSPTFFGKHSVIGRSLTVEYNTKDGSREETTLNIRPTSWSTNATENLQAILVLDGQNILKFDLKQLKEHYTADTYITVEVLSKKYCKQEVKWYIVTKESRDMFDYKPGDNFVVDTHDNKQLLDDKNIQERSCSVPNPKFPANLPTGDLSGILLDIKLNGPGRQYVHEFLPLLDGNSTKNILRETRKNRLTQVEGNYLLLADSNNTILGLLKLERALTRDTTIAPPDPIKQKSNDWVIWVCVCFGAIVVCVGSVLMYKICLHKSDSKQAAGAYINLPPDAHPCLNGPVRAARLKPSGKIVYVHVNDKKVHKIKTEDAATGRVTYEHPNHLMPVNETDQDPQLNRYVESNGSTNGSSLTRSRGTVAEENVYTTMSPTPRHPNTMTGSVIASPESSSSSLSSQD